MTGSAADGDGLRAYPTADGSFSLESERFGEAFHNSAGALNEARAKFSRPAELGRFCSDDRLRILDVCVGLGYNTAVILDELPDAAPALQWWGLELDRRPLQLALEQPTFRVLWKPGVLQRLEAIQANDGWNDPPNIGRQLWGDARTMLATIPKQQRFDLILQDAFSPNAARAVDGGISLTWPHGWRQVDGYSPTADRRRYGQSSTRWSSAVLAASGPGRADRLEQRHDGGEARWPLCGRGAGVASAQPHGTGTSRHPCRSSLRDPDGIASSSEISERRVLEQQACGLEPTNAWQRRWAHTRQKREPLETQS